VSKLTTPFFADTVPRLAAGRPSSPETFSNLSQVNEMMQSDICVLRIERSFSTQEAGSSQEEILKSLKEGFIPEFQTPSPDGKLWLGAGPASASQKKVSCALNHPPPRDVRISSVANPNLEFGSFFTSRLCSIVGYTFTLWLEATCDIAVSVESLPFSQLYSNGLSKCVSTVAFSVLNIFSNFHFISN